MDLINSSNNTVGSVDDVILDQSTSADCGVLTVNTTLTVLEDQRYIAIMSFSNLTGCFNNLIKIEFGKNISVLRNISINFVQICGMYPYSCMINNLIGGWV